jgi:hypothetical protein
MFMTYIRTKLGKPSSSAPLAVRITLKSKEASPTGAIGTNYILSRPVTSICVTSQSTLKNPAFSPRVHLCVFYVSPNSDISPIQNKLLVFRRFRKSAKSDYGLRHVCLSVHPHGKIGIPLDGFREI